MDSFRCIQASRLLLDYQLHGTGALGAEPRRIAEDATITAFERVIDQCLAHRVDCLLISGECFDPGAPLAVPPAQEQGAAGNRPGSLFGGRDAAPAMDPGSESQAPADTWTASPTLRGAAALARGLARLQELDVAVIVQQCPSDGWENWPAGLRLPPNVHLLEPHTGRLNKGTGTSRPSEGLEASGASLGASPLLQHPGSVPVARAGKLLATIAADDSDPAAASAAGWRIQLTVEGKPRTVHLAHDPRGTQGVRPSETGARGCKLIEFDESGEPREKLLPVAPVRWEQFELAVAPETTRDDLLQEMASLLEQSAHSDGEDLWLAGWELIGEGPLFESLQEAAFRERFLADLSELEPVPHAQVRTHSLRLSAVRSTTPADALAADCVARLRNRFAHRETALAGCLAGSPLAGGPWEVRLESLFAELDAGEVAHDACRGVMQWFAGREELSS